MTRVAIYARYSDDLQNPLSIDDQLRTCSEFSDHEGFEIIKSYIDPALSAFLILLRPGIQKLMNDARTGIFDAVVAEGLDRTSRAQQRQDKVVGPAGLEPATRPL